MIDVSKSYTVIMAARPRELYILEAIQSICDQTFEPDRIVVVINGVESATSTLGPTIQAAFPDVDVRTISQAGMIPAFCAGLDIVTTPYVAFLDSDDVWAPEKQERQLEILEAQSNVDAVSCEAVNFYELSDGQRVQATAAVTRMFSAVSFRTDVFARFGRPDASVNHFAWLVRWWALAQNQGIRTEAIDYRGLWRRLHESNSWVTDGKIGRRHLLRELRSIQAEGSSPSVRDTW